MMINHRSRYGNRHAISMEPDHHMATLDKVTWHVTQRVGRSQVTSSVVLCIASIHTRRSERGGDRGGWLTALCALMWYLYSERILFVLPWCFDWKVHFIRSLYICLHERKLNHWSQNTSGSPKTQWDIWRCNWNVGWILFIKGESQSQWTPAVFIQKTIYGHDVYTHWELLYICFMRYHLPHIGLAVT